MSSDHPYQAGKCFTKVNNKLLFKITIPVAVTVIDTNEPNTSYQCIEYVKQDYFVLAKSRSDPCINEFIDTMFGDRSFAGKTFLATHSYAPKTDMRKGIKVVPVGTFYDLTSSTLRELKTVNKTIVEEGLNYYYDVAPEIPNIVDTVKKRIVKSMPVDSTTERVHKRNVENAFDMVDDEVRKRVKRDYPHLDDEGILIPSRDQPDDESSET